VPRFSPPTLERFFDNRLIIAWKISQPVGISPLNNLVFRVNWLGQLVFIPNQEPEVVIPKLADGNEILISWVVQIPEVKTEVDLSVHHETFTEKYHLIIDPNKLPP
jgi:hypothetical protein